MDNDDKPIGQILSRRDALKLLSLGSAALLASCAAPEATSTLAPTSVATVGPPRPSLPQQPRQRLTVLCGRN